MTTVKSGLLASGWYARRLARQEFPGVVVLCYHGLRSRSWRADEIAFPNLHVSEKTFEQHCQVIAQTCHPIGLNDWRLALAGNRPLPPRSVLMTFDDGYRSVFEIGRPILQRYRIPAAMFICTDAVRDRHLLWFDVLARQQGEAAVRACRALPPGHLGSGGGGALARASENDPLALMSIPEIQTLADEGFEVGVHTASHARLSALTPDRQQQELSSCRDALEEWTGHRVTALAYPWGKRAADYTDETVVIAKRLGFDFAFTTYADFARPTESPLERSRFLIVSEVTSAELAHRLAHSWPR